MISLADFGYEERIGVKRLIDRKRRELEVAASIPTRTVTDQGFVQVCFRMKPEAPLPTLDEYELRYASM